jgi:hypothetical protein
VRFNCLLEGRYQPLSCAAQCWWEFEDGDSKATRKVFSRASDSRKAINVESLHMILVETDCRIRGVGTIITIRMVVVGMVAIERVVVGMVAVEGVVVGRIVIGRVVVDLVVPSRVAIVVFFACFGGLRAATSLSGMSIVKMWCSSFGALGRLSSMSMSFKSSLSLRSGSPGSVNTNLSSGSGWSVKKAVLFHTRCSWMMRQT